VDEWVYSGVVMCVDPDGIVQTFDERRERY